MKKESIFKFYFCNNCKKEVTVADDILLVEEDVRRTFCSEDCIEQFFNPLIDHYEKIEKKIRKDLKLNQEPCLALRDLAETTRRTVEKPEEIWEYSNEVGERIYHIFGQSLDKSHKPYTSIVVAYVFRFRPSFVVLQTTTCNEEFKNHFRVGEKVEDISPFIDKDRNPSNLGDKNTYPVDPETQQILEQKKSAYLAQLMENLTPTDISFEQYSLYEEFVASTLEKPDEVYKRIDADGETILTYIRSYDKSGISFYYYVICLHYFTSKDKNEDVVIPILCFPSLDANIYHIYNQGEQLSGNLKN